MSLIKIVQNNPTGNKDHCVICGRNNGILSCHGCRLTYCGKHVIKHRHDLGERLYDIMYDFDSLRDDIDQTMNDYFYYQKSDKWEKETIKRVQFAAQAARDDLRDILEKSRRRLIRLTNEVSVQMKSARKADDFAENEISKWAKQLNELRAEMKSAYSVQLIEDQRYPIYPITFTNSFFSGHSNNSKASHLVNPERFLKTTSTAASIENNGLIVKHIGEESDYAHILGKQLYSQGRHTNRFKIVQCTTPYIIFFGCISTEAPADSINYNSPYAVGWFGYNEIYQHGTWHNAVGIHGYDSSEFDADDTVQLTFDCDQHCIEFRHERLNRTYRLSINVEKAPLPWQILLVLVHEDDCVKILPNR